MTDDATEVAIQEIKRTLYGPNRDDGLVVEVKIMASYFRDVKRWLMVVSGGIVVDIALVAIQLITRR